MNDKVVIEVDKSINGYNIAVDKNQFIELLQILFENSIDALNGKGKIELSVKEDKNILNEKDSVQLIIRDFGKGIKPEYLEKVFDPYFTTKKDGTGLGLAFTKKIMEDNKGSIIVESILNKGTTVILKIPKEK